MSGNRKRPEWADLRRALQRISDAVDRCHLRKSKYTAGRVDGLIMAMDELRDAFPHIHVRIDGSDRCALCDLDLRDDIHIRERKK